MTPPPRLPCLGACDPASPGHSAPRQSRLRQSCLIFPWRALPFLSGPGQAGLVSPVPKRPQQVVPVLAGLSDLSPSEPCLSLPGVAAPAVPASPCPPATLHASRDPLHSHPRQRFHAVPSLPVPHPALPRAACLARRRLSLPGASLPARPRLSTPGHAIHVAASPFLPAPAGLTHPSLSLPYAAVPANPFRATPAQSTPSLPALIRHSGPSQLTPLAACRACSAEPALAAPGLSCPCLPVLSPPLVAPIPRAKPDPACLSRPRLLIPRLLKPTHACPSAPCLSPPNLARPRLARAYAASRAPRRLARRDSISLSRPSAAATLYARDRAASALSSSRMSDMRERSLSVRRTAVGMYPWSRLDADGSRTYSGTRTRIELEWM